MHTSGCGAYHKVMQTSELRESENQSHTFLFAAFLNGVQCARYTEQNVRILDALAAPRTGGHTPRADENKRSSEVSFKIIYMVKYFRLDSVSDGMGGEQKAIYWDSKDMRLPIFCVLYRK